MKRDYTLPEIIFSVLALAFVGVFTARMYTQAENMQNKARDMDMAVLVAQSAVESFKAASENPELCVTLLRQDAHLPGVNSALVSVAGLDFGVFGGCLKSEYVYPETVYFDSDFRDVPEIDEKGFKLTMDVADDGMGLFDVKVDVVKVTPYFGETETRIFSLETSVYKGQPPKTPKSRLATETKAEFTQR